MRSIKDQRKPRDIYVKELETDKQTPGVLLQAERSEAGGAGREFPAEQERDRQLLCQVGFILAPLLLPAQAMSAQRPKSHFNISLSTYLFIKQAFIKLHGTSAEANMSQ